MSRFALLLLLPLLGFAHAATLTDKNTLFGHSIKNGHMDCTAKETTTYEFNCTSPPCVVTQLHIPSIYANNGDPSNWEQGRLHVYVDGEDTPSVDVTLLEIAHVGSLAAVDVQTPTDGSPFGNELFAKTAKNGGVSTTFRIPFQHDIRLALVPPPTCTKSATYWFIVRGLQNLLVNVGDITLPSSAKLIVQRIDNKTFAPLDLIPIGVVDDDKAGALMSVFFDARSADPNYLEGCVRFQTGGQDTIFLSSGTEDFFLSSSYYDMGEFNNVQSGLTYDNGSGNKASYKTFLRDPIVFNQGLNLTWRNMETNDPAQNGCPNSFPYPATNVASATPELKTGPMTATTLVWMYVWDVADTPRAGIVEVIRDLASLRLLSEEEEVYLATQAALGERGKLGQAIMQLVDAYYFPKSNEGHAKLARMLRALML